MARDRALALATGKALYERARDQLADGTEFIELTAGVDVPSFSPEPRTLAAVDAVMARTPFQHVVATSESNMAFAGFLRSRYGLAGLSHEQSLVVTNKWRMKQAVRPVHRAAAGWLSGPFLEDGPRPAEVVVKPLSASSARGVRRMPCAAALQALRATEELLLVEEAVDATAELHCDGVVRDGRLRWAVVSSYDRPVLGSDGCRASVHLVPGDPRVQAATDVARRVLPAVAGDRAVFHLEILQAGEELVFGEIALRPAGTGIAESIQRCFGADLWLEFVALQVGARPPLRAPERAHGDLSGVVLARPSAGGAPLAAEEARRLPGVTGIGEGNLAPGEAPPHACSFRYLAFFDGLRAGELEALIAAIGGAGVPEPA